MTAPTSPLRTDARAAYVLWRRDVLKFFRHGTRIAGAVAQPLIFWLVLGAGLAGVFRLPAGVGGAGGEGVTYFQYFYPGVLVMVLLFSAIFGTMTVIEDRNEGFLQAVLVAAASRLSLVLGKTGGAATVALLQTALFLIFLPWAGFPPGLVDWPLLMAGLFLSAVGLTASGFCLAWWLDSQQAYHAIMSVLLVPGWLLSGALFPASGAHGALATLMQLNPLAHTVELLRRALYGGAPLPAGVGLPGVAAGVDLLVVGGFAAGALVLATLLCSRRG